MPTFKQWQQYIEMKKAGESGRQHVNLQSLVIRPPEYKAMVGVIEGKISDPVEQNKLRNLFNIQTRFQALGSVFSSLESTSPALAVEIAEAAAGLDYKSEMGTSE